MSSIAPATGNQPPEPPAGLLAGEPEQTILATPDSIPEPAGLTPQLLGEVLLAALHAGQLMMENGANTSRVEETVYRLGRALGAQEMEVFATPSGIVASALSQSGHRTFIKRVTSSGVKLSVVAAVLDVSRAAVAGRLNLAQVRSELEQISQRRREYAAPVLMLGAAINCACFAVLFGGGPVEALISLIAAGLAQGLRELLARLSETRILNIALTAAAASGLALGLTVVLATPAVIDLLRSLAQQAGFQGPSPMSFVSAAGVALPSAVLFLLPGVAMISSVVDLFRGHTLSGIARAAQALLTLTAIAAGVGAVLLLSNAQIALLPAAPPPLGLSALMVLMASLGVGVLFDLPRRALLPAAIAGVAAIVARVLGSSLMPLELATFAAGMAIGVLAQIMARILRLPAIVFSIPGFIPLVSGVIAFRSLLHFANKDYTAGMADLVQAALLTAALAGGLGTISALASRTSHPQ